MRCSSSFIALAGLALAGCAVEPRTDEPHRPSAIPSAAYAEAGYAVPCAAFLDGFRAENFTCGGPPELSLGTPERAKKSR